MTIYELLRAPVGCSAESQLREGKTESRKVSKEGVRRETLIQGCCNGYEEEQMDFRWSSN